MAALRLPFGDVVPDDLLRPGDWGNLPTTRPPRIVSDLGGPELGGAVHGLDLPNRFPESAASSALRVVGGTAESAGSSNDDQEGQRPAEESEHSAQSFRYGSADGLFHGWYALRFPNLNISTEPQVSIENMARACGLKFKDGKVG